MCGILGGVNIKISPSVLDTIKHRGPDRQALHVESVAGHNVTLAHTRLSIVDLSDAGNQPMVSDCGNYVLIFNGEIYNHLELRRKLKYNKFRGHSDTETLLYLLIEKGVDALNSLNGIFAFAFLDKQKQELLIARDPFGVKPLYYYLCGNRLVFSSEIRPINSVVKNDLDILSLSVLLNLRYLPSPYTLFKGIYKVRPGHYGCFKLMSGSISYKEHTFISHTPDYSNIDFNDAVDLYGEKLKNAVSRQLMGDVDMGVLLSGGIDSALVAGIAANKVDQRMKAFTVGFDAKYQVDEIKHASETAEYFGLEHHVVKMDSSSFFDTFSECTRIVEEPLATTSCIPMYYLSKLASEHVKVVLTGQGADEPLGGYGRYQGELLYNKYPSIFFKIANTMINTFGIKKESLIRGARSLSISDDVRRFMSVYSLFTVDEVRRMTGIDVETDSCSLISYYYSLVANPSHSSVDKMMAVDLHMDLADDLLLYTDKITMNFALECRVPMLDLELVNFLGSLPTSYKVKKNQTKIIHKAFAKKLLPENIINRPKLGFQSPTDIWFRDKSAFIESKLKDGKIGDYIPAEELLNVLQQHKQGYNREKQIFMLLSINEWLSANIF